MTGIYTTGPEVGDSQIDQGPIPFPNSQALALAVDDLLPDDFELFELEGDDSIYFSYADMPEEAIAEIRPTTPREKGYSEGVGPQFSLTIVKAGPDADATTTWFDLEQAIDYATKSIRDTLRV